MYPQQPQALPPPIPPVSAPPRPAMSRGLHVLFMGLAAVVLLGGGFAAGYYVRGYQAGQAPATSNTNSNQGTNSTTTTPGTKEPAQSVLDGMQMRSRDTQRQTAINSVATQLEVFFNEYGGYPGATMLQTDSWPAQNLKGIDITVLHAPGKNVNSFQDTSKPDKDHYGYQTFNADFSPCTVEVCTKFNLYWRKESTDEVVTKASLN